MPCSVSSSPIVLLLAITRRGVLDEFAAPIFIIILVKPGPSVPEVAAISPVTREKPSAAEVILPSHRPPYEGIPSAAIALIML